MVKLLALFTLASAVRVGKLLHNEDSSTYGSQPEFDDVVWTNQVALYMWANPTVTLDADASVVMIPYPGPIYHLQRNISGVFEAYYTTASTSISVPLSPTPFTWHFVTFELGGGILKLCISQWAARTLSCTQAAVTITETVLFSSTYTIQVSSLVGARQTELWDLNIVTSVASMQTLADSYTCHTLCTTCMGPGYHACDDFMPLVRLYEALALTTSPKEYIPSDLEFKGGATHQ
jgi:hypothetical protein